jgi:signal transduction histidine kinase/HD-like signal output (HDOD) protein
MTNESGATGERSVDVLLDRLDSLPTPTAVAMRLMTVLESDSVTIREVVDLISTDPALSARVVGLCSRSPKGRALGITSVERAVVLLGFDAVRAAALSVRLFEAVGKFTPDDEYESSNFDVPLFWRHSLAVAVLSERITQITGGVRGSTAFIGGLLHDIGHLALHSVAPQVFDSACEIADTQCISVDLVAQRRIGIDGRTAGRRIGSRWGLPQELIDSIWLLDQPLEVMRGCASSDLVKIISLSDAIIARDHVAIRGHGIRASAIHELAQDLGADLDAIMGLRADVLGEVEDRAKELGLDSTPTTELLLRSIARANSSVSRFALAYRERSEDADHCLSSLEALTFFLERLPFSTMDEAVEAIGASASALVPESTTCVIVPHFVAGSDPRIRLCSTSGIRSFEFSAGMPADVARDVLSRNRLERCGTPVRLKLRNDGIAIVALGCDGENHVQRFDPEPVLRAAWTAAIDDALLREQSDQLLERLAFANRELSSHREVAMRARAASSVGAIAAGAAHEINTPLTVIAGRSHLLAECLSTTELGQSASEVKVAAMKVAEIVEALAESAAPIEIAASKTDVGELLARACCDVDVRESGRVSIRANGPLPVAMLDEVHLRSVIVELLENSLRASVAGEVVLEAYESVDGFVFKVSDHGPGFSETALDHALDPFFSEQPAGRRKGLGLSTARRLVEAHGGSITIRNRRTGGTGAVVCITLQLVPRPSCTDGMHMESSEGVA